MKTQWMLLLVLLCGALLITPVMAQDNPGTIADIVIASATGDQQEFTTLLAAIQAADPAVLQALADPEGSLTVFAPTDEAFAELADTIGEDASSAVLADPTLLTSILLYHVVNSRLTSADAVEAINLTGGRYSGPTLNGQYIDLALDEDDNLTIDGAGILAADIEASNGLIHIVDTVLLPELRTIAEIVTDAADADEPEFTTLLDAIEAADPVILETLSDPEATLTVFAPIDTAFDDLDADALETVLDDTDAVSGLLLYHVLTQKVYTDTVLNDLALLDAATSREGLSLDTALPDVPLTVQALLDPLTITVNEAVTLVRDIDASNGVIHAIDTVLLPPG